MMWRVIYYIVMACYIIVAAVMLAERFPWLANPVITFAAIGVLAVMLRPKTRREK